MQRCRAFREQVGQRIILLESVDYFETSECFGENVDGEVINWSDVRFIFGDDGIDAPCSSRFYFLAMICICAHVYSEENIH